MFERAGCGFSHVRGAKLPPSATQHRPELAGAPFEAMGVSLVFHPRNPYVPTVHMNVRMLAATVPGKEPVCWFGGGMDLTPYYGFEEDAVHFHQTCKTALTPFGDDKYPRFKTWCDEYFYLKHRQEQRGVGGVFFDDFSELGFEQSFAMMQSVGFVFADGLLAHRRAAAKTCLIASANANFSSTAVVAMSSSTWCGTGARTLACSRAGARSRFCCPCRRWRVGRTSGRLRRERLKPSFIPTFCLEKIGFELTFIEHSKATPKRIGMYGGAFDPPHNAHVALAKAAVEQLGLDALHVIPTGHAWHKAQQLTLGFHRLGNGGTGVWRDPQGGG